MIATRIDRSAVSQHLELQRWILPQDRALELLEGRARLDSELVDEDAACVLICLQSLGLAAGSIQRRHQLPPQALAERVLADERLELPGELVVAPEREVGLDAELDRPQPDLLEPARSQAGRTLVGEVRERRASPQRQCVDEPPRRVRRQAAGEQAPPLADQSLEPVQIELVGLDPDHVAGRPGREHVLRQRLTKSRDVDAQR